MYQIMWCKCRYQQTGWCIVCGAFKCVGGAKIEIERVGGARAGGAKEGGARLCGTIAGGAMAGGARLGCKF